MSTANAFARTVYILVIPLYKQTIFHTGDARHRHCKHWWLNNRLTCARLWVLHNDGHCNVYRRRTHSLKCLTSVSRYGLQ